MADPDRLRCSQALVGAGAGGQQAGLGCGADPGQAGYAGVGPNFLPWVVAVALALCGAGCWAARSGGYRHRRNPSGADVATGRHGLGGGRRAGQCGADHHVMGFILSCTLCFMLAVRGLRGPKGKPAAAAAAR
jgi:putative tricarboxylic transport membrane protein